MDEESVDAYAVYLRMYTYVLSGGVGDMQTGSTLRTIIAGAFGATDAKRVLAGTSTGPRSWASLKPQIEALVTSAEQD